MKRMKRMQQIGNIDLANKDKIFDIVKNHFDLTDDSFQSFKGSLFYPFIDPLYKQILDGSKDLRRRFKASSEDLEVFDKGWKVFKEYFPCFINFYNVTYNDFRKNKIQDNKRTIKIGKALVDYYAKCTKINQGLPDSGLTEDEIKQRLEITGQTKLPLSPLEIVFSLNFADWFLCSTAEKWTSCLNLESRNSSTYWAGISGTIVDRNRALVYVTDGKKKKYQGIEVDRLISRSWLLLDSKNYINVVKFYPINIIDSKILKKIINEKFIDITENFVSKYNIPLLFFKNNISAFIYNDNSKFLGNPGHIKKIIGSQQGGVEFFDILDGCRVDPPFYFRQGLGFLIEKKISLCNIYYGICVECNKKIIEEEDLLVFREKILCNRCYNEKVVVCYECDEEILKAESHLDDLGDYYCNDCFERLFVECSSCGKSCRNFETKGDKKYCFDCIKSGKIEHIVTCNKCGKENTKDIEFHFDSREWTCEECRPKSNYIVYGDYGDTTWTFTTNANCTGWTTNSIMDSTDSDFFV